MSIDEWIGLILLLSIPIGIVFNIHDSRKFKPKKNTCTKCGCEQLSQLRSINTKKCTSCGHEMDWNLDPGQLPLVRSNRMVKRE